MKPKMSEDKLLELYQTLSAEDFLKKLDESRQQSKQIIELADNILDMWDSGQSSEKEIKSKIDELVILSKNRAF